MYTFSCETLSHCESESCCNCRCLCGIKHFEMGFHSWNWPQFSLMCGGWNSLFNGDLNQPQCQFVYDPASHNINTSSYRPIHSPTSGGWLQQFGPLSHSPASLYQENPEQGELSNQKKHISLAGSVAELGTSKVDEHLE